MFTFISSYYSLFLRKDLEWAVVVFFIILFADASNHLVIIIKSICLQKNVLWAFTREYVTRRWYCPALSSNYYIMLTESLWSRVVDHYCLLAAYKMYYILLITWLSSLEPCTVDCKIYDTSLTDMQFYFKFSYDIKLNTLVKLREIFR